MPNFYDQLNLSDPNFDVDAGEILRKNAEKTADENAAAGAPTPSARPAKSKLDKYPDTSGEFTNRRLRFGLWLARHRLKLYRYGVGVLILASVIFWGYSLWVWGDYFIFGIQEDQQLAVNLSAPLDYTLWNEAYGPRPLKILGVEILSGGVNKWDAVAEVYNSNDRYVADFDFHFVVSGARTRTEHARLLPLETRPIAVLGLETEGSADLVIENMAWKKISRHEVENIPAWQESHLAFTISDQQLTSEPGTPGIVRFKITNNSAYGYKQPFFYVGLLQGGGLAAILPLQMYNFKSLETQAVDLRVLSPGVNANEIQIFPVIDIYDKEAYLLPPS